jgi:hypothetical protein
MGKARRWSAVLSVGLLGACGTGGGEKSAPAETLQRDLTLQPTSTVAAPAVEVASPVELRRAAPPRKAAPNPKPSPKRALAPTTAPAPEASPTPEPVAVPVQAAVAIAEAPAPAPTGRELAPGQTVTVLPASTGPAEQGPDDVYLPVETGRSIFKPGAGDCPHPPRRGGRPIGIVGFR